MNKNIHPLSVKMKSFIQKQNEWVMGHYVPGEEYKYNTSEGKLYVLQGILDRKMYNKSETRELQALGICFGEVLCSELNLTWVEVEDDSGNDPALRYKDTTILFFPRTMISKRIEKGEDINVCVLLSKSKELFHKMISEGFD